MLFAFSYCFLSYERFVPLLLQYNTLVQALLHQLGSWYMTIVPFVLLNGENGYLELFFEHGAVFDWNRCHVCEVPRRY